MIRIKILFWNLAKNSIEKYIIKIVQENDIDICIFSEYKGIDFTKVITGLNDTFSLYEGMGGCEKIILIARNCYMIHVKREQNRYTIYESSFMDEHFIIAGIHLQDRLHSDADGRKNTIRALVQDVLEQEKLLKNNNTLIIGDFNASPFDEELVQKDAFNAVLFKALIDKSEYVTYEGKKYRRFYNPMLNCFSEDHLTYGSIYNSLGLKSLYWYFFDQVIVRKSLVNRINSITIIKAIGNKKLIKEIRPNDEISDHLPLLVELERRIENG